MSNRFRSALVLAGNAARATGHHLILAKDALHKVAVRITHGGVSKPYATLPPFDWTEPSADSKEQEVKDAPSA